MVYTSVDKQNILWKDIFERNNLLNLSKFQVIFSSLKIFRKKTGLSGFRGFMATLLLIRSPHQITRFTYLPMSEYEAGSIGSNVSSSKYKKCLYIRTKVYCQQETVEPFKISHLQHNIVTTIHGYKSRPQDRPEFFLNQWRILVSLPHINVLLYIP